MSAPLTDASLSAELRLQTLRACLDGILQRLERLLSFDAVLASVGQLELIINGVLVPVPPTPET